MPIAKITGQGLAAIGLSVALLWACLIGERVILDRSYAARAEVMRELRRMQMRQRVQPASAPAPVRPHRNPVTLG